MLSRTAEIRLVNSHPEVYDPFDDSFALVNSLLIDRANLLERHPTICMEISCSSGYVINSLALMLGKKLLQSTLLQPTTLTLMHWIGGCDSCDEPPYVPMPQEEISRYGIASAWAGGVTGRSVIDMILPVADKLFVR
ncbi:S-adenosyl-L-methionine-dependent methyltransferase superfamily protein [Abeliophyllum distichum]|uniref:S-adenosyl-L-methionine-dependent methyltransferase superfamily protein n=1 Tax=Abeliophyllum distichum TaxID=126358 RepID=A0ABD1SH43_9LAMI